jgi:hypothetical protein
MLMPPGTDTGNRTTADEPHFTLEPDRAFLGCLMRIPIQEARRLLGGMRPEDAHSSTARQVLYLTIHLAVHDLPCDPVTLLSAARNQGWLATEHHHQRFAQWLIESYRAAPFPEAAWVLKRDVLEDALRRALTVQAQQVLDLAEHGSIDRLREVATLDTERIADLWQRYHYAAQAITPTTSEKPVRSQLNASPKPHRQSQSSRSAGIGSTTATDTDSRPGQRNQHSDVRKVA